MDGNPDEEAVCRIGSTGQLLRRTLVSRPAPQDFRASLQQRLLDGGPHAFSPSFHAQQATKMDVANRRRID